MYFFVIIFACFIIFLYICAGKTAIFCFPYLPIYNTLFICYLLYNMSFWSVVKSVCHRAELTVMLLSFYALSSVAGTVVSYSTTDGKSVSPQGMFYDKSGNPLSYTKTTTSLTFSGELQKIDFYAFHTCNNLKTLVLPNTVTEVGYMAFSACKNLEAPISNATLFARLPVSYSGSYTVSAGVKTIASGAFCNCDKLTDLVLPDGVTTIGKNAFAGCTTLVSLTLPASVNKIDECAFWNCSALTKIEVGQAPPQVVKTEVDKFDASKCALYVPKGCVSAYKSAEFWKDFGQIIEGTGVPVQTCVCQISLFPFLATTTKTASHKIFSVNTPSNQNLTSISFDLVVPSELTVTAGSSSVVLTNNGNGNYHVEMPLDLLIKSSSTVALGFAKKSTVKTSSVQIMFVKNVELSGNNGSLRGIASDAAVNVFVGSGAKMVADYGVVTYCGNYSSQTAFNLLMTSIPTDASVVDLTDVSSVPAGAVLSVDGLPNLLVKVNTGHQLGNTENIVVDNHCASLRLTDKHPFGNDVDFTAARVSYERAMTSSWGTVCLPYEVCSDNSVQYYELASSSVSSSEGTLSFAPVAVVEAGVPAVFRKLSKSDNAVTVEAMNVTIPASDIEKTDDCAVASWVMKGTFDDMYISPSDPEYANKSIYYIAQDQFWLADKRLHLPAYRCWFEVSASGSKACMRFNIDEANDTDDIQIIELEDGTVQMSFDLQGRQFQMNTSHGISIENGAKVIRR